MKCDNKTNRYHVFNTVMEEAFTGTQRSQWYTCVDSGYTTHEETLGSLEEYMHLQYLLHI